MHTATKATTPASLPPLRSVRKLFMSEGSIRAAYPLQVLSCAPIFDSQTMNRFDYHKKLMIHVSILASGSSGNAILAKAGGTSILIDAGLSAKRLNELLAGLATPPEALTGILLTHEHVDHTRGLKGLCGKNAIPVFTNPLTADSLRKGGMQAEWRVFSSGAAFQLGDFNIHPFSVPHDAADPVGFVLRNESSSFAVLTDLGHAPRQVVNATRGVNAVLIEANHDETLLQNDQKRPWSVKQRILSRHGHLSNQAAASLVAEIASPDLRHVLLAHLSEDCNAPTLATGTILEKLQATGNSHTQVHCPGAEGFPLPHTIAV
jgi:phosphoribosyl 1,2-cyclic phosphodiesterase